MKKSEKDKLREEIRKIITVEMNYIVGEIGNLFPGREGEGIRNVKGRMLALIDEQFDKIKG